MRNLFAVTLLLSSALALNAETALVSKSPPQNTPFAIAARSAISRTWESTVCSNGFDGQTTTNQRVVVELATGLCHKDANGNYVDSSDEIVLLPDGTAAATNCATSVYFPADIGSGVIKLTTSDGKLLQNGPAFLALDDGTNTVLLGTVTNSLGQLVKSNQVLYPDIFHGSGFRADLLTTVRKSGFESDMVFREQIPDPASLGLGANACVELLTEWFNTPEPAETTNAANQSGGLRDVTLHFGSTTIGRGRAFVIGTTNSTSGRFGAAVPVYKRWLHPNSTQTFLVESVPYQRLAPQLEQLPVATGTVVSAKRVPTGTFLAQALPSRNRIQPKGNRIQLAETDSRQKLGVVLDYVTLNDSAAGYTFLGDGTTYYISGPFSISGTTTIDAGAVLKFASSAVITADSVVCETTVDQPALFTSVNDDSVGDPISGVSTGSPSMDWGTIALDVEHDGNTELDHLRIQYAGTAIYFSGDESGTDTNTVRDVQIAHCGYGFFLNSDSSINAYDQRIELFNGLIYDTTLAFNGYFWGGIAQHLTVDGGGLTMDWGYNDDGFFLTNSLIANVNNFDETAGYVGLDGAYNGFFNCGSGFTSTFGSPTSATSVSPFASGASAGHYLTTGCPFRDIGTTQIDSNLMADIQSLTTYAPQDGSAPDTNTPDLGYHYSINEDSDHDGLPDWWEWQEFGSFTNTGGTLDSAGNTLLFDYLNNITPTAPVTAGPLGVWTFDTSDWLGSLGQVPILATNIELVSGLSSNAVEMTNIDSYLFYNLVESNGHTNLDITNGTVSIWFKPYWSSANLGGTGPGANPPLFGALVNTNMDDGFWEVYLGSDGNTLFFDSTDYTAHDVVAVPILWVSNQWYQVALTYSPSNSTLYINGVAVTNVSGIPIYITPQLMLVGNDIEESAVGAFDELKTFNYPLSDIQIQDEFYNDSHVPPFITTQPLSQTVLFGSNATFTAEAEGAAALRFQWYFNTNTTLAGATGPELTLTNVQPSENGNYSLVVTNAYGSVTSSVVSLAVVPAIAITNPANNATFNATGVDIQGTFSAATLKQITVNGIPAFTSSNSFQALDVPLIAGTNIITAIAQDFDGSTNTASITVIGTTNSDGSMNEPVQLQAAPIVGFSPLQVTFTIQTNVPGTILQVLYDVNGDGIFDLATNTTAPVTYIYGTNREYFPVATIQTTSGWFSSSGGWNSIDPNRIQITVTAPPVILSTISITDPVDIKWTATSNLYVLSGSTATITEFDSSTNIVRSLAGIGSNPSGLDVDATGNVYVALTGSNQVWKFNPTTNSFIADTNFGFGGFIGKTNGTSGANTNEFNAPFDVAVSPDGETISISDSGNNRIQSSAATNGAFVASFGTNGSSIGQFNTPEGLTYDAVGTLYIVDSGNDRVAVAQGFGILGLSGTNGASLGQFSSPANISVSERGIYVADTDNNRIQCFNPLAPAVYSFSPSDIRFAVSTNLNQPASVAAVNSLTNEMFYVADKGNNRVLLYQLALDDPSPVWNNMTNHMFTGDISGGILNFSVQTADQYRSAFFAAGISNAISEINQIGTLTPVFIRNDTAEYYFEQVIAGQTITFPVDFVKENGVWRILEF